jgi:flagellar biosynthesis protein FliQ
MGFDSRCFAAGVLGLGARGYLKVDQQGEAFDVQQTGRSVDWLAGDRPLADALFSGRSATTITKTYDPKIAAAQGALSAALKNHYKGVLFSRNSGSIAVGIGLSVLTIAACIALNASAAVFIPTAVALIAMLVAFSRWMPSYTLQGRRLKDEIEGLRQYLGVAERDNLARLKAPELTPQEFARMLPYALALDVEKTWADRFAAVAGTAAVAAAVASYYHSDSGDGFGSVGDLGSSLGDLGDAVSAAATAPGSSSGSGGGGSSGGGGGGGGGSGW